MESKKYAIDSLNSNDVSVRSNIKGKDGNQHNTRNKSLLLKEGDAPENESRQEMEKRLKGLQKALSRTVKGSKNRYK